MQANRAKKAGAAGLMALPTMVYQQDSREAIQHFIALARGVDLPIMIYNNHVAYKVDLSPRTSRISTGEKNIVAVEGIEPRQPPRHRHDQCARRPLRALLRRRRPDAGERAVRRRRLGVRHGQQFSARSRRSCSGSPRPGGPQEAVELYRWFMPLLHLDTAVKLVQYIKLVEPDDRRGRRMGARAAPDAGRRGADRASRRSSAGRSRRGRTSSR